MTYVGGKGAWTRGETDQMGLIYRMLGSERVQVHKSAVIGQTEAKCLGARGYLLRRTQSHHFRVVNEAKRFTKQLKCIYQVKPPFLHSD